MMIHEIYIYIYIYTIYFHFYEFCAEAPTSLVSRYCKVPILRHNIVSHSHATTQQNCCSHPKNDGETNQLYNQSTFENNRLEITNSIQFKFNSIQFDSSITIDQSTNNSIHPSTNKHYNTQFNKQTYKLFDFVWNHWYWWWRIIALEDYIRYVGPIICQIAVFS